MKVLQLCNKPPLPQADGGTMASHAVTAGLLDAGCRVKLLCIATQKHPFLPGKMPDDWKKATEIEAVFADTRVKVWPAFFNLFGSGSYNISRFYSKAFDEKLAALLQRETFDIVHLESLYMTPYLATIRRYSKAPVVLRAHNVEHLLVERLAKNEKKFLEKKYLAFLARRLRNYEANVLPRIDGLITITQKDAGLFRDMHVQSPVHVLPFAMPLPAMPDVKPEPLSVFHLGSMDWKPNLEGVHWLLHEVWPLVLREEPGATLHLAGRRMPGELMNGNFRGVKMHGEVDDTHHFMARFGIMAVPLFSGGGMRVKIVEGMALGKAIVSTTIGMEGIEAENGVQAAVADDAKTFAQTLIRLLRSPAKAEEMGKAARDFAGNFFDREKATGKLLDFYGQLSAVEIKE
ncbi:MAG: group 1 glycosyl transferase [Bacteroidetes bacterium]|nr:MAG: group 1 glycosyl transferase [Bacteroidota bacterium]